MLLLLPQHFYKWLGRYYSRLHCCQQPFDQLGTCACGVEENILEIALL